MVIWLQSQIMTIIAKVVKVIHISGTRTVHKDTIPSQVTFNATHSMILSNPVLHNLTVFMFKDNSLTCYVINTFMHHKNRIKS